MTGDHADLEQALDHIDPATLDYQGWTSVGMALKESGLPCELWDRWSLRDHHRYHQGECERKWAGFGNGVTKVTSGTIVRMAEDGGWVPTHGQPDEAMGWDDVATAVSPAWADDVPVEDADEGPWDPARQLSDYLAALFDDDEHVGVVTKSWERDGRIMPQRGTWAKTAGQMRQELAKGDVGAVVGDWPEDAGAWIRFNPLGGPGWGNSTVTEGRSALVVSDERPSERQQGMIEAMHLPCAAVVSSGGKSIHAIVKVDAGTDYDLYRKRVEELYGYCSEHGFAVDTQNKNPSRLSRMPGVTRRGKRQLLLATDTGCASWSAWEDWVAESEDDLPDTTSLADVWECLPDLATPLIGTEDDGVLRHGHKMLVAGPSKAGKSFLLMELAAAIAEGREWLRWPCARGRVLYTNLEIDPASCLHRFRDLYVALGWEPRGIGGIDVWNLRGHAVPMDQLAPRLIHRARDKGYAAVIIDPIYKVITGDENSADEMAAFCNQFDKVAEQLGTAVIYCHHHSKGAQGGKRSMDRASGSGVFARDPDTLLDMSPLELTDEARGAYVDLFDARLRQAEYEALGVSATDKATPERGYGSLTTDELLGMAGDEAAGLASLGEAKRRAARASAWRIEGTLREFPSFDPLDVWFDYPLHTVDTTHELARCDVEGEGEQPWKKGTRGNRDHKVSRREERSRKAEEAFDAVRNGSPMASLKDVAKNIGVSDKTARSYLDENGGFVVSNSMVCRKEADDE